MKKIAILTTFTSHDDKYSLCRVVIDQIKMLYLLGVKPVVFVQESGYWKNQENFTGLASVYKECEIVQMENVPCHNEVKKDETFDQDVDSIYKTLSERMSNDEEWVVLTHDIIYQPAALKHNIAARKLAKENGKIQWRHWVHSATSPYILSSLVGTFEDEYIDYVSTKFPNSKIVFFNYASIKRISHNFKVNEQEIAIVPHPTDIYDLFRIDLEMNEFLDKYDILEADYVSVYPCRLDRGKQVEFMIKTVAALKKLGNQVRAIVVDFHSTGGDKVNYRNELKNLAKESGLTEKEIIFTSEEKPEWQAGIPADKLSQIYIFSNVMVMPSVSESYSLVTQESMAFGAIVVANEDFPPFRDILGENVIWRQYSSNIDRGTLMDGSTNTTYENEDLYHMETAMLVHAEAKKSKLFQQMMRVRKQRNIESVARNYLLPILY